MLVSRIGNFTFLQMKPPPPGRRQLGFFETRSGIDDYAFWKEAKRGIPWTTVTFRDTVDHYDASALFRDYESIVFAGPQLFMWAGITPSPVDGRIEAVMVLDVRPVSIQNVIASVGGLLPGGRGFVIAEWTLIATEVPIS